MSKQSFKEISSDSRGRVAKEAASLLYFGLEKEYKHAKMEAAHNLGLHVLPSNLEVALALDRLAEEIEGSSRQERLLQMRVVALEIMRLLEPYNTILIGSVWRGTICKSSDIDIEVYHDSPRDIATLLEDAKLRLSKTGWINVNKHGETHSSFHIHADFHGHKIEIIVRRSEETKWRRICDTFGDEIRGLSVLELGKQLAKDPWARFLPR